MRELKNILARAKRKLAAWRKRRNEWQQERERAQARRRENSKLKREKKQQKREVEARFNRLVPPGGDGTKEQHRHFEQRAHELKTQLVDLHHDIERLNENDREIVKHVRNLGRRIEGAGRNVRYYIHVRLPHVRGQIEDKRRALADRGWNPMGSDLVTFDGKPTPEWIAYRHEISRASGWGGYQTSGFRTPEESEQLCYQMCGQPTCPGRCAGRYTNHAKRVYPEGATDVTDYYTYGSLQRALDGRVPGVVLINALGAADPVHFSASGR